MAAAIHTFSSLPSTNTTAAELAAEGAAHGEIVRAYSQSQGRGRLGKIWSSPPNKGLYFSLILRPRLSAEDYPKLTMTTGVAVATVLEQLCGLEVMLKWPNDILVEQKKCAGILCEAHLAGDEEQRFGVVGIGLNVTTAREDLAQELRAGSTSLLLATGNEYHPEVLLRHLTAAVLEHVAWLENEGFKPLLQQWKKRDFLKGKWLKWLTHAREIIYAQAQGPDDHGNLLVQDEVGVVHRVLSGDISLAGNGGGAGE